MDKLVSYVVVFGLLLLVGMTTFFAARKAPTRALIVLGVLLLISIGLFSGNPELLRALRDALTAAPGFVGGQ